MIDNRDEIARVRAAGALDYEIDLLVERTGIARSQAVELLKQYGTDRAILVNQAKYLVSRGS